MYVTRSALLLLTVVTMVAGAVADASTITVPDEVAGIQEAIYTGADSVLIRSGIYDEVVIADRGVVLLGLAGGPAPTVTGLVITNPYAGLSKLWSVSQLSFVEPVELRTGNSLARLIDVTFSSCDLRAGLQHTLNSDPFDVEFLRLLNCRMGGDSHGTAAAVAMVADTVAGTVNWRAADTVRVEQCHFTGGTGTALTANGDRPLGRISSNRITNYSAGIAVTNFDDGSLIQVNDIRDVAGTAIAVSGSEAVRILTNVMQDCGAGLTCTATYIQANDNTVLRSGSHGLFFTDPRELELARNVVGYCQGAGLALEIAWYASLNIHHNTLFRNTGSGIDLLFSYDNTVLVHNNIVAENRGWGLRNPQSQMSITLGCNDWFANDSGAVLGATFGASDKSVDPFFCDVDSSDVTLAANSPLLGTACNEIGARGIGCGVTATFISLFRVTPHTRGLQIEWRLHSSEPLTSWLEREDTDGVWQRLEGTSELAGTVIDAAVVPGTTYRYRLGWRVSVVTQYSAIASGTVMPSALWSAVLPNPAPRGVAIALRMPETADVLVQVFDLAGREVARLHEGRLPRGEHRVPWDRRTTLGTLAASGWYVVRIKVGAQRPLQHKLLLMD